MNPILAAVVVLGGIGAVCAIILVIASKYMSVEVDENFEKIRECLPGANCGACGYAGCDGYAGALASGDETKANKCIPGGSEAARNICEVTGISFEAVEEKVAVVKCRGDCDATHKAAEFHGSRSCRAAKLLFGCDGDCKYGCIGYGDCEKVCPNKAITVFGEVAKVNTVACTGCGACMKVCPQKIITVIPKDLTVYAKCSNKEKGPSVKRACSLGCLGCGLCAKKCSMGAITMVNNLPVVDYEKCAGCGICASVCPSKCLIANPKL